MLGLKLHVDVTGRFVRILILNSTQWKSIVQLSVICSWKVVTITKLMYYIFLSKLVGQTEPFRLHISDFSIYSTLLPLNFYPILYVKGVLKIKCEVKTNEKFTKCTQYGKQSCDEDGTLYLNVFRDKKQPFIKLYTKPTVIIKRI